MDKAWVFYTHDAGSIPAEGAKFLGRCNMMNFDELVDALRSDGYDVKVSIETGDIQYAFAQVTGKGITAGFCEYAPDIYPYIANRIAADNSRCFDKWSKCPLVMQLPVDYPVLKSHLQHLGSQEGYDISNDYSYLDSNPYPYEMEDVV